MRVEPALYGCFQIGKYEIELVRLPFSGCPDYHPTRVSLMQIRHSHDSSNLARHIPAHCATTAAYL